jgi:hypothetical protein
MDHAASRLPPRNLAASGNGVGAASRDRTQIAEQATSRVDLHQIPTRHVCISRATRPAAGGPGCAAGQRHQCVGGYRNRRAGAGYRGALHRSGDRGRKIAHHLDNHIGLRGGEGAEVGRAAAAAAERQNDRIGNLLSDRGPVQGRGKELGLIERPSDEKRWTNRGVEHNHISQHCRWLYRDATVARTVEMLT